MSRLKWDTKGRKSIAICGDTMLVLNKVSSGQFKGTWRHGTADRYDLTLEAAQDAAERHIEAYAMRILNALKGLS